MIWLSAVLDTAAAQTAARLETTDAGLLFTEMVVKPGETSSRTLRLVRANFRDGNLIDRVELYTGDASEFGYQAEYRLVDNRYVVFRSATVFDLTDKKIVNSLDGGQVLTVEGPLVYFFSNKSSGAQGVFCYNTSTGKQERVANLGEGRWGLRGAISPSGTKAIVRELKPVSRAAGDEMPYTIVLDRVGKPRESLGEFAAICGGNGAGSIPDAPPGVWLDDDRFLTQTTQGKIVVLHTGEKQQENVVDIPPTYKPGEKSWTAGGAIDYTPLGFQQPRFSLLADGRVVYEADKAYFIDVGKKTWETARWRPLGRGFNYSANPEQFGGMDPAMNSITVMLQHDGGVIGTSESVWWTTAFKPRAVATDGYIAIIERALGLGKGVQKDGVRVWSAASGKWQTIDVWADSLVGWVK
jgi:hypothetical protein